MSSQHLLEQELHALLRRDAVALDFLVAGSDALWYWNLEAPEQEWVSPRFKQLLGYAADEAPATKPYRYAGVAAEDVARTQRSLQAHLADPSHVVDHVVHGKTPDGRQLVLRTRAIAIRDDAGRPMRVLGVHTDVSAQMRTESSTDLEAGLGLMLDNMTEGVIVADLEGHIVHFNRAALVLHGGRTDDDWSRPISELDGMFDLWSLDGTRVPLDEWPLFRILRGETLRNVELRFRDADRSRERVHAYGGSIVTQPNGTRRALLTITDVTERHAAMEEVSSSAERLRLANEVAGIGTYDGDFRTGVAKISPECARMFGMPMLDTVPLASILDSVHPEDRAEIVRRFDQADAEGNAALTNLEVRYTRPDGDVRWISWSGRRFYDDGPRGRVATRTVGTCVDVTERRRIEQRLTTQSAVSRALAESTTLSEATPKIMQAICDSEGWDFGEIWELDASRRVLSCAEVWHRPDRELSSFVAATRSRTFALGEGLPGRVWKEGEPRHVEDVARDPAFARRDVARACGLVGALAFPIYAGARFLGVIAFLGSRPSAPDPTMLVSFAAIGRQIGAFFERKRAEAERVQLEDQLRQAQKMEALGQLSGGIAHDFNNLLAAILANAEMARAESSGDREMSSLLDDIGAAAMRGRDLVDQILALARQRPERRALTSLRSIAQESTRLLRATLPAGVALSLTFSDDSPTVLADPTAIQQVLINLCTNAWHALEGSTGSIRVHIDAITLDRTNAERFPTVAPGAYARILVQDDGRGMTPETRARIFEPFFTTKTTGRGTGLGLAAVFGIVKGHDGAIHVSSTLGRGSTFEIVIPRATGELGSSRTTSTLLVARGDAEILYVDDEEMLVRVARRTLGRLGYHVTAVSRARDGLAAFMRQPERFSLVVTDMNMPEMSGLDLLREIRRLRTDIPAIVVSGHMPDEHRAQVDVLGNVTVLAKPWATDALARTVAQALDRAATP